jgi:hypothetical protein
MNEERRTKNEEQRTMNNEVVINKFRLHTSNIPMLMEMPNNY